MVKRRADARILVIANGSALAMRELVEAAGARVIGPVAGNEGAAALVSGGFDAVLADLRRSEPPVDLIDALPMAATGVVLLDRDQLDDIGALAFATQLEKVCDTDAIGWAMALATALVRRPLQGLHEESEEESAAGLRRISEEMARLARTLSDIAAATPPPRAGYVAAPARSFRGPPPVPAIDAAAVRGLIRARRLRDQYFAASLFADPAWDMLLDLTAARLEGGQVSVSSLCIAAAVPATTALRWIGVLADTGLIVRFADANDRRRIFIALSDEGAAGMVACLNAAAKGGALPL